MVLVGAGPTGVELAAAIAHMAKVTLRSDFRRIDPSTTRIILLDNGPRILAAFSEAQAQSRGEVFFRWAWSYATGQRDSRLILGGAQSSHERRRDAPPPTASTVPVSGCHA